jgi:hypothetical protein
MTGICAIKGCGKPTKGRGWCSMHYIRWQKHGDPEQVTVRAKPEWPEFCVEPACTNKSYTSGLCRKHYQASRPDYPACSIEGCTEPLAARGWCQAHYGRWRHHGDPLAEPPAKPLTCTEPDCDRQYYAKGLCEMHNTRRRKLEAPPCSEPGCIKPKSVRGWCYMHYNRWRKAQRTAGKD